jgi:hypothetical protein
MTSKNLVLNPDNPLSIYEPSDGCLGHALSGSVYQGMYSRLVTDPSRQLLCPLICYIDGTQIDRMSQFSLEPFSFTLAIFRSATHSHSRAWHPFGYVQNPTATLCNDTHLLRSGDKMKNYHAQLGAMLRILGEVQSGKDTRLKNVEINLFGKHMLPFPRNVWCL